MARWFLVTLAGRGDWTTGRGWTTYDVLARDAGVDRRTIGRMFAIVEYGRWIVRFTRGRTRTTFQIVLPIAQRVRAKPLSVAAATPAASKGLAAAETATELLAGYADRRATHYDLPPDGQRLSADELERVVLRVHALGSTREARAGVVSALLDAFFRRPGRAWDGGDAFLRDHFHPLKCFASDLDALCIAIRPKSARFKPKTARLEAEDTAGIVVPERERARQHGRNAPRKAPASQAAASQGCPDGASGFELKFRVPPAKADEPSSHASVKVTARAAQAIARADVARQEATAAAYDAVKRRTAREARLQRRAAPASRAGRSARSS